MYELQCEIDAIYRVRDVSYRVIAFHQILIQFAICILSVSMVTESYICMTSLYTKISGSVSGQ